MLIPEMSDHETVIFEVLTRLCRHNSQLRKVHQFHKADRGNHCGIKPINLWNHFFQENPYD